MGRRMLAGGTLAAGLVLACVLSPASWADRNFDTAFSRNDAGDVRMAANSILSCQGDQPGCPAARQGTRGAQLGNNSWAMRFVDADSAPGTFNSSSAVLELPAGATVLFARLYWGANVQASTRGSAAPNASARDRVLLRAPASAGYSEVQADRVDLGSARSQAGAYQAYADVAGRVQAGGGGDYTVANVQSGTGDDRYGGWALVVAYAAPGERPRNLTVFDGFVSVNSGDPPREISVSGFRTPAFGPVRSQLGLVAYEGDLSLGGDSASVNGTDLSDATNPANNFFNSAISRAGVNVTTRDPAYPNNLGYDAIVADLTGRLANNARSAAIRAKTTGDTYIPGVVFLVTDLYAPDVQTSKSVVDLNGGLVEPGDELEYTIAGTNQGQDAAASVILSDQIPAGTEFVPSSLAVIAGAGAGARSDAADGDQAEFTPAAGQVLFRVGAGASATAGGRLLPGEPFAVRYRARVAEGTASGTPIVNQARLSLFAETLGFPISTETNETRLTVAAPDLAISKGFQGTVAVGQTVTYTFSVSNVGDAPSRGEVLVTDPMPPDISFFPPAGPGWTCTQTPTFEVSCTRSDPLAAGASYPPISISGVILPTVTPPLINTAILSGGGDVNQSNNTSTAAPPGQPFASLGLDKQVTPDTAVPGARITYLLTVSNRGGFGPATGVQLNDPLPAGLTLQSAEALDQGSCSGAVNCSLGSLAVGASARVRIVATVNANAQPGDRTNAATVTSSVPDLELADNTASATVKVNAAAEIATSIQRDAPPRQGGPAPTTTTITNNGPATVPGGSVNTLVPAALNDPTATVPGGSCTTAGRLVSCSLLVDPPGWPDAGEPRRDALWRRGRRAARDRCAGRCAGLHPAAGAERRDATERGGPAGRRRRRGKGGRKRAGGPHRPARLSPARDQPRSLARHQHRRARSAARGRPLRPQRPREQLQGEQGRGALHARVPAQRALARAPDRGTHGRARRGPDDRQSRERGRPGARSRGGEQPRSRRHRPRAARPAQQGGAPAHGRRGRHGFLRAAAPQSRAGSRHEHRAVRPAGAALKIRRAPGARRSGKARCWRIDRLARGAAVTRRVVASVTRGDADVRTNRASVRVGGAAVARAAARVGVRRQAGACPSFVSALRPPFAGPAC